MIDIAYTIFLLLVGAAILAALIRLVRGPSIGDRINAADVLAISAVGIALAHGWRNHEPLWLDVAMIAGLVLFVGTTAVTVFLDPETLRARAGGSTDTRADAEAEEGSA